MKQGKRIDEKTSGKSRDRVRQVGIGSQLASPCDHSGMDTLVEGDEGEGGGSEG